MRRTDRLFEILQLFRSGRLLLGRDIAERLEVSVRTVYRDIETLVASGIPIEGERGVGFLLREPIFLPPLTLSPEELRALHMGVEVVRQVTDPALARAAEGLLGKIAAVLPAGRLAEAAGGHVAVYAALHAAAAAAAGRYLGALRRAVADKQVLDIDYQRLDGTSSHRRIRPLQVEYWGHVWTCLAWCEQRDAFRLFRIDRISACTPTGESFLPEAGKSYADYLATIAPGEPTAR